MRPRSLNAFLILVGLFLAALVSCNLIVQKFFAFPWPDWVPGFGGSMAILSVGILPYPLTFLVTDLISEIYGRKRANQVVWTGLVVSIFVVGVIQLAMWVPAQTGRGFVGAFAETPSAEKPLEWSSPLQLTVRSSDPESELDPQELTLNPAEIPKSILSGPDLAAALEEAKDASWPNADDWHFAWEPEWAGDLSKKTGRGRLRLEDVTAHPHMFWEPKERLIQQSQRLALVLESPGGEGLAALLPRGANIELPKSPITSPLFHHVFGGTWRAILASMIAYLFAQYFDIQVYHLWKRLTRGKALWLRNNFSTITSQFVDSFLVVGVLFYGVWPNEMILTAALSAWIFKMLVALTDTPFLYLGVWLFVRFDLAPEDSEYARIAAEKRMARIETQIETQLDR